MHWFTVLLMTFCCAFTAHAQNVELKERQKRDIESDCRMAVIDLYVVVETTRLVGPTNLKFVQDYLKSVYKKLSIHPDKTRISLTSFGGNVTNIASLNDVTTREKADDAFDKLNVTGRGVKVHTAMEFVADNLFTPEHGRNEDNEAICLISMGSRINSDISESVKKLQQHCRVIVVGSGYAIYRQIKVIPSEPVSKHLIYSVRYKDLSRRVNHLLKSICTQPVGAPRAEVFDVGPHSIGVRWVAQTFASKYQAEIRELGGDSPLARVRNIPAIKTFVRFSDLRQASTYVAHLWAFGRDGVAGPKRVLILNTGIQEPVIQVNQSSVTSSSVRLSWNANSEVSVNYFVTVKAINNASNVVSYTVHTTHTEVTGLSSGTNFAATVSSRSSGIRSKESEPGYFLTVPSPPDLKVQQVKHISIDLMWPPVAGAGSYVLSIYDIEANVTSVHEGLTNTTFKISDLIPSQKYQFQAYTIGTTGLVSALSRLVTAYTAPSNPDDVTLDYVTEHTAQLHWSPQPAAVKYRVIVTSPNNKKFWKDRNLTDTEVWVGGLKSGFFYKFSVYSVGKGNVIDYNVVYPKFVQTVPSPPEGVRVLSSNPTSLEVTWNHTIGVKVYHVEAEKMLSGVPTGDTYRTVNSTFSTALVGDLEPGVEYRLSVKTEGYQGGISKLSETVINSTVPAIPGKPRATYVNMTFMAFTMEPAEGAVSYEIEAQPLEKDENHRQIIPFTDADEITVDKLLPGLWYSIKVRSINAFGKMNPESSEVLHEQSVPIPPHIGSFWKVTSSSLLFRWPKVKGALSYYLYVSTTDFSGLSTESLEVRYHTNDTEYQVWGLSSGTLYSFRVQSIGHSDRTSSLGAVAYERTIPGTPTGVRHTGVTPSTVTLQWDPVKGARQYEIVMQTISDRFETRLVSFRSRVRASGLETGTWFNFTVYARDAKDRLNENGSVTVNVQTVPLPPSNVRLRDAKVDGFTVRWNEMWGASGYFVRAETLDVEALNREVKQRVNDSLHAEVGGLDSGTRYRFYVSSIGFQEQVSRETNRVSDTTLPVTPEKPKLETVTTQSMSLLWSDVKGATYFYVRVIQFAPSNNTEWEVRSDEAGNEVGGLVPGAWYNMSVFSVGTRNRRNWVDSEALQAQTIPLAPITINISDVTNSTIQLSWNSVVGAGYYVISVRHEDSNKLIPDTETEETESLQVSLEPGTEYTFRVTSIGEDADRRSSKSAPIKEETDPATPDQPTVSTVTSRSVTLTWNDVKGARKYLVKVTNLEDGKSTEVEAGGSEFVVGGLNPGTHYNFNVFSIGKLRRRSEYGSPDISAYTAPATPYNVRTVASTTTDMELVWVDVKGATSYLVTILLDSRQIRTLTVTEARLIVDNLTPGTEYDFYVTAVGMEERRSEQDFKHTDATEPSTPSRAAVTSFDETSVSISWEAVPGNVIEYVIMFEEEGSTMTHRHQTKELKFTQTGIKSGTRYVVKLQTIGDGGKTSDQSESVVQQTMTTAPDRFVITSVGTDYVTLEWSDVTGASGYELTVTSDTGDIDIQETSVTSTRVTSLEAGSKYLFSLKSIGDVEIRSNEANNIETTTVPANPTGLETTEVQLNWVFFIWQSVKGAVRYKIKVTSTESDVPTVDDVTATTARVRSLRPGAWYNFTVFSVGEEERVNEEGSESLSVQTNPRFPGRFVVDNFTTTSIGFWWRSSYGASYYDVTVATTENDVLQFTTTDTSHILTSLQSGTTYDITMQVVGQQEGRVSDRRKAFSQATLPGTPSLPVATFVSTETIRIEWDDVRGAVSYDVTMNSDELEKELILSSVSNNIEVGLLRPGGVYSFSVFSLGVAKNGIGSETLTVQTVTSAPGNFNTSDVTTTSVYVSWDEVYGATSYKVRVISEDEERTEDTSLTSFLVTSLKPGTAYRLSVRSVGMDDVTESEETEFIVMATLPQPVDDIRVDDVTTTDIGLTWNSAPGARRYNVIVTDTNDVISSESAELRVTGLRAGSWYEFRVHSIGDLDVVNFDPDVYVRKQTVPNPPNQIDVDEVTTTSIHLSWRKIHGASSYDVILSSNIGDVISTYNVPSSESPKYIISNLMPGNHYVVTIRSVGEEGQMSSHSREIREGTRPAATSGVDVGDVTPTSVELTWQPVIGAEKYHVIYRTNGSSTDRHVIETVERSSNVIGLEPGTWYEFVVFSIGIKDRRNERGSEKIQIQTVPLAPDDVTIANVTTSSVMVYWSDVTGALKYRLEYGNIDDDVTNVMETTLSRVDVTSLSSGTRYWFVVKSIGEENRMSEASLQVEETTVPSRPSIPLVVGFTTTSLSLDWDDVKGTTRYVITVTSDDQFVQELSSTSSEIVIENLNSGTFYDVTVFSIGKKDRRNQKGSDIVTQQTVPSVPANFQLSDVTTDSLMTSWNPVNGAVSYIVTLSTDDSDVTVTNPTITTTVTSLEIEGLNAGTEYRFTVKAVGYDGITSDEGHEIRETTLPNVPSSLVVRSVAQTTVELSWLEMKGATRYRIVVKESESGRVIGDVATPTSGVTISALEPGLFYDFTLNSVGTRGRVNEQHSVIVTQQTVPASPLNFRVSDVTTTSVTASWDDVTGASSYIVNIDQIVDSQTIPLSPIVTSHTSFAVSGLNAGFLYRFTVKAVTHENLTSDKSHEIEVQTVPLPPSGMNVADVTSQSIQLIWDDVIGAEYYVINILDDNDIIIRNETSQSNRLLVADLTPGNIYRFTFISVGKSSKNRNPENIVTQQTRPTRPENFKFDDVTSSSLQLSWDSVNGALYYVIAISTNGSDDTIDESSFLTNKTWTTFQNFAPGTEYWFTVKAVGHDGLTSEQSHEIRDTTLPDAPRDVRVSFVESTSIQLIWDEQKGATAYQISVSRINQEANFVNTDLNSATISNLEPGDVYTFVVVAMGTRGRLSDVTSAPVSQQTAPTYPQNILSNDVTTTSFKLSWDDVNGAVYYVINTYSEDGDVTVSKTAKTFMTLTNLMSGSEYRFTVTGAGIANLTGVTSPEMSETTLPSKPTSVTVSDVTMTSIGLTWSGQKGAEHYVVTIENNEGIVNKSVAGDSQAVTGVTVENLTAGTWHEFVVYSVGVKGQMNLDGSDAVRSQTVPSAPTDVIVTQVNVSSVSLKWQGAKGAESYQIRVHSVDFDVDDVILTTNETFISVESLSAGTAYDFYVAAVGEENQSSVESHVVRETTIPDVPANVFLTDVDLNSATIKWNKLKGAVYYKIFVKNEDGDVRNVTANRSPHQISELAAGTWYDVTMTSVGLNNRTNRGRSDVVRFQTVVETVRNITVSGTTNSSFMLDWEKIKGAITYEVLVTSRDDDVFQPDMLLASDAHIVIENLDSGTMYDVTIRTIGEENQRSFASEIVSEATLPQNPHAPNVIDVTQNSVTLAWTEVKGAVNYRLKVFTINETFQLVSPTNDFHIDNLFPGTFYGFQIFAVDSENRESESGSSIVRQQTVPEIPSNISVAMVTTNSVFVSWTKVFGASSYRLSYTNTASDVTSYVIVNVTSHMLISLDAGRGYEIRISSVGFDGKVASEESGIYSTSTLPEFVTEVSLDKVTTTSISVAWQPAIGANRYELKVTSSSNETSETPKTASITSTATALRPGSWYKLQVISIGDLGVVNHNPEVLLHVQTVPLPPRKMEISQINTKSLHLSWNKVHGAKSYLIRYFASNNNDSIFNQTSNVTSSVISNLISGTTYVITVTSVGVSGRHSAASVQLRETTRPATAAGVNVDDVTTTSVLLRWKPVKGAEKYHVFYRTNGTRDSRQALETVPSQANVIGLEPGTWYEFVVFSIGIKDRRNERGSEKIQIQTVPLAPDDVIITNVTTSSVIVHWSDVTGADEYRLEYGNIDDDVTNVMETTLPRVDVTSLSSGTRYWFVVKSIGEESRMSEASLQVEETTVPSLPDIPDINDVTTTSFSVNWNDVKGAEMYKVYVSSDDVIEQLVFVRKTNIRVSNLIPGTGYDVGVTSVGAKNRSNPFITAGKRIYTVPSHPSNLQAANVETASISLTWNRVEGSVSYLVEIITSNNQSASPKVLTSNTTSLVVTSLTPGTEYVIVTKAVGVMGLVSGESNRIVEATEPERTSFVTTRNITQTSVNIEWEVVRGAQRYEISYTKRGSPESATRLETVERSSNVIGLEPGTWYEFVVFSIGIKDRRNERGSEKIQIQTVPLAPDDVIITNVTTSSVTVHWSDITGASKYRLEYGNIDDDVTNVMETTLPRVDVTSLSSGTRYWFVVKSIGEESRMSEASLQVEETTVPSLPDIPDINDVTTTSFSVNWNDVKGAEMYKVYVSSDDVIEQLVFVRKTNIRVSNLKPGTGYDVGVTSVGAKNRSNPFITAGKRIYTVPSHPSNLQAANVETASISLTWNRVEGAVSYLVEIKTSNNQSASPKVLTSNTTSLVVTSLTPGIEYVIVTKAVGVMGLVSGESNRIVEATEPERTSFVTTRNITQTSVNLEWEVVRGAQRYEISYTKRGSPESATRLETVERSSNVIGLEPGTWYEFVVFSIGIKDRRNERGSEKIQIQTVPLAPDDVIITNVTTSSVTVHWSDVTGASKYRLEYGNIEDDVTNVMETTLPRVDVTSLSSGTRYWFVVKSIGEESRMSEASLQVEETTVPNIAGAPKVDDVSNSSVTLSWNDVRGAVSYVIKVRLQQTDDIIMEVNSSNSDVTIRGLDAGEFYNFTVLTIGYSGRVNNRENSFAVQQTVPNPPENFAVDDVTFSSVTTSWGKVNGAELYIVEHISNKTPLSSIVTSKTSIVIEELLSGITYRFTVKAVGHENLTSAKSHELVEQTVPSSPSKVAIRNVETNSVGLEWTNAIGASSYLVDVTLRGSSDVIISNDVATNATTIGGLSAGEIYQFYVYTYGQNRKINKDDFAVVTQQTVPLPPAHLTVDDVTSTSLQLAFSHVTGSVFYLVFVKSHSEDTLSIMTSQTSILINELSPGTTYQLAVKSVGHDNITSESSHEVRVQTVPLPPPALRVTTVTSQTIDLEWSVAVGARSYVVNVTKSDNSDVTRSLEASNNNIRIGKLRPGTLYNIVSFSVGNEGRISQSGSPTVTQQTAPNHPQNLTISEVTRSSLTLNWNKEKGADSYIVMHHKADDSLITNVTVKNHMIVFEKLAPVTVYRFTVVAVSPDGHMSEKSERITEMTLIDPPRNIEITDVTTSAVSLNWDPVRGAASYLLQVLPDVDGSSITFPSDDVHDDVTGLVAGTRYGFRVTSVDTRGRRSVSWSQEVVAVTVPLPPSDITMSSVTSRSFLLQWSKMKGAVNYDVTVRSESEVVKSQKVTHTRMSLVGLEPGTLYFIEIRSVNRQKRVSEAARERQRTAPLPPKVAVPTQVNEDSVALVWDPVRGAASYDVTVTEQKIGGKSFVVNTNDTSAFIGNIQSGTLYRVHVTSVTRENIKSIQVTSLLVRTRPGAPTKLVSERINETAIGLSWNEVRGAVTYTVYVISAVGDKRKAGTEFETKLTVASNNVIVGDLKPGVNYTFEVTANNLDGFESKRSQSLTQQTFSLAPVLPNTRAPLVTILNATQTSLVARWPKIENAVAYVIILRSARGDKEYSVKDPAVNSLEIDLLFADTVYNVTMKAVGVSGKTTKESFPPSRVRTKPFPPRTPTGLLATRIRSNHVIIVWTKASRALSYDVTVRNSATDSIRTIRNVRETTANVTNLRHRGSYIITVTSVGKFERSRPSRPITVVPRYPSPVMPRHVVTPLMTIGSVTHDSFIVTIRPIQHAVSYEIQVKSRREIPKTVGKVSALTPTLITELQQNTVYDVTFVAIGREGDRSRESDVVKTRTQSAGRESFRGRLVPGVPGDFQILHVTPNDVTVTWELALRAIGYRVRAQNTKSGRIFVYNNATPPYVIKGLGYRNRYMLSVVSIGRYFDSVPSSAVPVTIPYPNANNVSGISISQITSSGFLVTWTPTPFARSYMLVVAIGNSMVRRINGISTNEYRLKDLAAGTDYNVTVNAVSSDSTTLTVGDWVAVKTAPFHPFARSIVTATEDPTSGILESVITAFLETIQTIPDSPRGGDDERINRGGFVSGEDLEFRSRILEHIQQISSAVQSTIARNTGGPKKVVGRRKRSTEGAAFESIVSIAREVKLLKQSRDATNVTINSISDRLSQSLAVVVASQMDDVTIVKVKLLLLPLLRQRLRMILLRESPVVIHVGSSLTDERILSTFAPPSGVTSTGFKVMWVGYQNVHRFKLVVTKLDEDSSTPVFEGLRSGRSVFISNLEPSTNYDVTVRPATLRGDVIPGIVGKIIVKTRPAKESTINVTVTSLGTSHVSLAINKFPKGVGTLKFEIRTPGNNRVLQLKLIKPQHKVVAFTSLTPNTDYVITASPVTSGTGIAFRHVVATKQRRTFVRPTPPSATQNPTQALASPTGLRKTSSTTNTVTLEWSSVRIADTDSRFIRYNLRFYKAGTQIVSRSIRLLRNNKAVVRRLTYPFYDVTVTTYNMRSRSESQESPLLRVNLT